MIKLRHSFFIVLVTLCMVAAESEYKLQNRKLRASYNKLLHAVTSVNEERLSALKKFFALQNYVPKVDLRSDDEILAVIIPNTVETYPKRDTYRHKTDTSVIYKREPKIKLANIPGLLRILQDRDDDSSDDDDAKDVDNLLEPTDPLSLRQWKGCNKKASKVCKKACKKAFNDICADYKCSKSMKRASKKSCNRLCKSQFLGEDY